MSAPTPTTSELSRQDKVDHLKARVGIKRMYHRVPPGLYSLGAPDRHSPVFVTSNYTLSFDALRTSLRGIDSFILVLDTKGINVWCAAGKGTFSTEELTNRVEEVELAKVVDHRELILPQLGAPGVSAHEVRKRTGFKVEYGPVQAEDIKEYLVERKATEEMRSVRFPIRDRAVLIPIEVKNYLLPIVALPLLLFLLGGWLPALLAVTAAIGGIVLFPLLLPYLPTKDFSSKGMILGILLALPFVAYLLLNYQPLWAAVVWSAAYASALSAAVAYIALNFTGATPWTSRTGVRKEIFRYIPAMAVMFFGGIGVAVALSSIQFFGVI
jgi:hypothetical protein